MNEEVLVRAGKGEEKLLRLEKQQSRLPHRAEMGGGRGDYIQFNVGIKLLN